MRKHALLSSSGAHRWLNCPPSARLESHYPDVTSEAAREGTFAHRLAEITLRRYLKEIGGMKYKQLVKELRAGKTAYGDYYAADMDEYVGQYVDTVIEKFTAAQERDKGAELLLEQHLDFSEWVPDGFGSGDAVIVADGTLEVVDLKYGRGVPVAAEGNPQLRLYGLGALSSLGFLYDVSDVCMTIVQPRLDSISSETLPVEKLLSWGASIRKTAEQAYQGEGVSKAGPWCQFCRAAVRCKTLAAYQLELARYEFKDEAELSEVELADVLKKAEALVSWANKVKEYALIEAVENGRHWPGFKLVAGRSIRKITDPEAAAATLLHGGHSEEEIYKPQELKTLTGLEKALGRKAVAEELKDYIVKPEGKPVLVTEEDKRPEWQSAKEDFKEEAL